MLQGGLSKSRRIEIRDEGVVQGYAGAFDFVGSALTAAISGDVATLTATGGATPALTLLHTYTPSAASSVDVTSQINSATYARYLAFYNLRVSVDAASIYLRTDTSNGASFDAGAGNYSYSQDLTSSAAPFANGSASATQIVVATVVGNATNEGAAGVVYIAFLGSASLYPQIYFYSSNLNGSTDPLLVYGYGSRRSAAAIDSFQLLPSSGTFTGSVHVYGMQGV